MQKTKVVNLKKEKYDVYIGRGSKFGNPFSHLLGTLAKYRVATREEAIKKYKEYLLSTPSLLREIRYLKGKTLGCFCKPKSCHGDVIVEILEDLMEFQILLEAKLRKHLDIEARSLEEAMKIALKSTNYTMEVEFKPTWVDYKHKVDETGDLTIAYIGNCKKCNEPILDREIPGQPWNYAYDEGYLCYPCAK